MPHTARPVGIVLFEGFETLDGFGPVEVLGVLADRFQLLLIGPDAGPGTSSGVAAGMGRGAGGLTRIRRR
jgi:putative intracellular protease/amidase